MSKQLVTYKELLHKRDAELSVNSFVGPEFLAQGTGWAHSPRTCVQLTIGKEYFQLAPGQIRHLIGVLEKVVS